jgi:hypothetical protein
MEFDLELPRFIPSIEDSISSMTPVQFDTFVSELMSLVYPEDIIQKLDGQNINSMGKADFLDWLIKACCEFELKTVIQSHLYIWLYIQKNKHLGYDVALVHKRFVELIERSIESDKYFKSLSNVQQTK